MLVGIDYGSKLAGTTVLAYTEGEEIKILQSQKKQDADQFILNFLKISSPELVGIDAPLSLPGAFRALNNEFFYREADKELNAMSPMFLGGLTARAMKLSASIPIRMVEVYPGALARSKGWKDLGYKTREVDHQSILGSMDWCFSYKGSISDSHQLDGIIALYITWKIKNNQAKCVGNPAEGLIYF